MNHTEPRKLDIERYLVRELDKEQAATLEKHFEECPVCKEYYLSASKERDTFLRVYPYREVALRTKSSARVNPLKRLIENLARPALVPVYATLLIAVAILPFVMRETTGVISDDMRFKGGSELTFAYQRDGEVIQGTNQYRIHSGDKVQIFYNAVNSGFVSLLSIDETGVVSFYHPDAGSEFCTVETSGGNTVAYPGSIQFGTVSGNELVVMVFSEQPLKTADIRAWAGHNAKSISDLAALAKKVDTNALPEKSSVRTLLLKKG